MYVAVLFAALEDLQYLIIWITTRWWAPDKRANINTIAGPSDLYKSETIIKSPGWYILPFLI